MRAVASWAVIAALAGAAAFELALALGAGRVGPEPGDGVTGEVEVRLLALAAIVVAIALAVGNTARRLELAPIAAAAFAAAAYFTYDPYYAPSLRRYSDGGFVPLWWVLALVALAVANGAVSVRTRRASGLVTAALLVLCGITALFANTGH